MKNSTLLLEVLDYSDAKGIVARLLQGSPRLATAVKRTLACHIADREAPAPSSVEPQANHEREAALHIRKMVAEGEIIEEMQNRRLFYKSPVFL